MNTDPPISLLSVTWDQTKWALDFSFSAWLVGAIGILATLAILWKWKFFAPSFKQFEINQAEIGVGKSKLSFRPNLTDRQVAYAIWVELSTRKLGLPIDPDHDVIVEIYDSWYNFFSVTRELVKSVPVSQITRSSTNAIITLSIEVLNEGLRPHLTRWQARFRSWYDRELKRYEQDSGREELDPQQIQARFPHFEELRTDMLRVNRSLELYRAKMHELIQKQ